MAKRSKKPPPPPMQPIYLDEKGVARFRPNAIIADLFETRTIDLNAIAMRLHDFPIEDVEQFWQLLGYSVSGYGDLSFIRKKTVAAADDIVEQMLEEEL